MIDVAVHDANIITLRIDNVTVEKTVIVLNRLENPSPSSLLRCRDGQ